MLETAKNSENSWAKRKAAMAKRIASLGKGNPVIAQAVKSQKPPEQDNRWKNWEIVDELVSAARKRYFDEEGEKMNVCISNLSKALAKLATQKGLDKSSGKSDTVFSDEDY